MALFRLTTEGRERAISEARDTFRLALPLIIGQLSNVAMVFVDTVMAGQLSALDLAAVAIGGAVWSTLILFLLGVLLAVPSFVSNYDGAGQRSRVSGFIHQAFILALIISVFVFATTRFAHLVLEWIGIQPEIIPLARKYLYAIGYGAPFLAAFLTMRFLSDGLGYTKPTMYIGLLGLLLNIPADYILMYGKFGLPALGAEGCGYATMLVIMAQMLAIAVLIARDRKYAFLNLFRNWQWPDWARQREIAVVGLPIGLSLFVESSLFMAATLLMGKLDTDTVAGHQIALNVAALVFMIPLGISMAITVRVGNAAGRTDWREVRFRGQIGMIMVLCIQVLSAIVLLSFPEWITSIYTRDATVAAIAINLLFYAAVFQLPDGFQVAAAGALRGIKDTRWPLLIMVVAYWVVGFPVSYILGFEFGGRSGGIWIGLIAGLFLASVILGLRFFRLVNRMIELPQSSPQR